MCLLCVNFSEQYLTEQVFQELYSYATLPEVGLLKNSEIMCIQTISQSSAYP